MKQIFGAVFGDVSVLTKLFGTDTSLTDGACHGAGSALNFSVATSALTILKRLTATP
jgi:hypothetical protein